MLPLDSPEWSDLRHAYGAAANIPALLRQLDSLPTSVGEGEPWTSLWTALAHQGDVYPASFAAVPHVVNALARDPLRADAAYFHFPAWVEVCRRKAGMTVPPALSAAYVAALARLPALVAAAADRPWDHGFLQCALGAIAASKGHGLVAEIVLELSEEVADEFMPWFDER